MGDIETSESVRGAVVFYMSQSSINLYNRIMDDYAKHVDIIIIDEGIPSKISLAEVMELKSGIWVSTPKKNQNSQIIYCPIKTFNKYKSNRKAHLTSRFNPRNDRRINKRKTYLKQVCKKSNVHTNRN